MRSSLLMAILLLWLTGCASNDAQVQHLRLEVAHLQNKVDDLSDKIDSTHKVAVSANSKATKANREVVQTKQEVKKATENSEQVKSAVQTLFENMPPPPDKPVYTEHN